LQGECASSRRGDFNCGSASSRNPLLCCFAQTHSSLKHKHKQGLADLRALGNLSNITHLNVSCNQLTSLRSIGTLAQLRHLNIQRNALTSLDELQGLTALESLNAGGNKLTKLGSALTSLNALTELALHRNSISSAAELIALAALSHLVKLALFGNPAVQAAGDHGSARLATLSLLGPAGSKLQFLDSARVSGREIAAASVKPSWRDIAAQKQQHEGTAVTSAALSSSARPHVVSATAGSPAAPATAQTATELLPQLSLPRTKPSTLRPPPPSAVARKEPPVICFSARHSNGMPSVTLRRNGTGSFSWPSGGLAASADLDPAGGYRLIAMYEQQPGLVASVALSADASGGFAQYGMGRMAMAWKRGDVGTHFALNGEVLTSWSGRR